MKATFKNISIIIEKWVCIWRRRKLAPPIMCLGVLFFLFLSNYSIAQTPDQRAEDIQNGTFNIFMSADHSYYKNNSASDNNPYGYGYWVAAHALETLADAYQRMRNSVYRDRMKSIIAGVRKYNLYGAGTYHNDYYDDLEWLCLATFDCYNATKDPEFLDAVHQIWAEIKTGYSNGAMSWRKGCTTPCNNSIANSPAIIIAVKLYQLEGDNSNLQMAKDIHAWMKANVFNANGGIWDSPGNQNTDWQFSYNSGMFIGACLELSIVTGLQSYIDDGIKAAEFMMNYRNYNGGVFFLNEKGQGDGGLFKGIFAKWFTEFVRVGNLSQLYKDRYLRVINYSADYAWANAVNKSNYLISPDWSVLPSGTIDLSTQVSGVHLLEAAASLNKVHVYADINYAGFYSQLPVGSYTLAQLQARGVLDNDVTSFTIPEGFSVTVYENDNFSGASKTFTSNTSWLADWNDRISSVKIIDNRTYVVNAFQDINYGGYSAGLDVGSYTLAQLQSRGIKDNDITSFKITPGFKVTVYDGDNFTGASADYTADINWLADWNDKISSIKVIDIRSYPVTVYQDVNYGGYSVGLDAGDYTLIQLEAKGILNNDITSLKVAPGYKVTLYDGDNFTGASIDYTANNGWIADWNDRATSLRISTNGSGDGLTANYFNGMNFETPVLSRKDATINFDWGSGSPDISINVDQFSTRWTGQIQPRYSGTYTFYVTNDDGGRLWINNQEIINKWHDDGGTEVTGTIALTAGQKYDIKFEYYENGGGAKAKLEWSSTNQAREVVPQSQLYSNTLPTVSITSPVNNAAYNAPVSVTISASASDPNGTISKVEFYNGTSLLGSSTASPYSFVWNNVAAGSYTLTAVAHDNMDAVIVSSKVAVKVNAVVVNQPPVVSITSPANNSSFNAPATITLSANATDSDGTISKVEFFNGSQSIGSATASPYTISWNNVAAGTYSITAKATDNNNAVTTSSVISVVVKAVVVNQAPAVSITSPANNASFTAPASITLSANATDSDGTISKVEFFNGSQSIGSATTSPYNVTWSNVVAGSYSITAVATDNSLATTTSSVINVIVNSPGIATVYQDCNYGGYAINLAVGNYTLSQLLPLGVKNDDLSSIKVQSGYEVILYADDNFTGTSLVITANNSCLVNNSFNDIASSLKVMKIPANVPPSVSIASPANNASYNAPASITVTANASDLDGSIVKVDFFNGSSLIGTATTSPYTINWSNVSTGNYIITSKAYDNSNASTTSAGIIVNVNAVSTDICSSLPQYVENGGYVAGSKVKNGGSQYECKEYPYSGWCNGAAWAYAPGTGAYWTDAWYDKGSCNAKMGSMSTSASAGTIQIAPNPVGNDLHLITDQSLAGGKIQIINSLGVTVMESDFEGQGIDVSGLSSGMYTLIYIKDANRLIRQFLK